MAKAGVRFPDFGHACQPGMSGLDFADTATVCSETRPAVGNVRFVRSGQVKNIGLLQKPDFGTFWAFAGVSL
jgi:hypothetical protein